MESFTPYSALAGGLLIGLSTSLLLWFNGRIAGISGIARGLLSRDRSEFLWRALFLAGLVAGAWLFYWLAARAGYGDSVPRARPGCWSSEALRWASVQRSRAGVPAGTACVASPVFRGAP
jgi:uncharacterized membrane protein YedE/YeeE